MKNNINEKNHLVFGGCDTVELAKKYKTPLYVLDEGIIRSNCKKFKSALEKYYGDGLVLFASKALNCLETLRIASSEGFGIDAVSGGELFTAIKANIPTQKICLHGNNKSEDELEMAIKNNIKRIVSDDFDEMEIIDRIAKENNVVANVMLRIKPGIDAHTHSYVLTGNEDSKFGVSLETGEALETVKKALLLKNVKLTGFHCHIGSQIFETKPFLLAAEKMLEFIKKVKETTGFEAEDLDLGGGFGVRYTDEDEPLEFEEFIKTVSVKIKEFTDKNNIKKPFLMFEPGRSIVGEAGITLYTVGSIKEIPNIRKYVSVDGGMTDNPRYMFYKSKYEITLANKASQEKDDVVTVAGKCCESGDIIGEGMPLQTAERGDILAVFTTGAYNYSMSSNYNRNPRPALVVVSNGESKIAIKRETYEDLLRNDI